MFCSSCTKTTNHKKAVIGFSQCTFESEWRAQMLSEMQAQLSIYDSAQFVVRDAEANTKLQEKQIRELAKMELDVLIISPNETEPLSFIVDSICKAGLPVVLVDRQVNSSEYTTFIGADNLEVGELAAQYALTNIRKSNLQILEIKGLKGSSPAMLRSAGFNEAINKSQRTCTKVSIEGNWNSDGLEEKILLVDSSFKFDVVYAHNDEMAAFAKPLLMEQGLIDTNTICIGIDALACANCGINYVAKGILNASVYYPTGGNEAIEVAKQIIGNKKVEKTYHLETFVVDGRNFKTLLSQSKRLKSNLVLIEQLDDLNINKQAIIKSQEKITILLGLLMAITTVAGILLFYFLRNAKKRNQELREQKKLREKLIGVISHDTRSPLVTIKGILEMINNGDIDTEAKTFYLNKLGEDVDRTIRQTELILEWAKIELSGSKPKLQAIDILDIVNNSINHASSIFHNKNIAFKLASKLKDKVVVNDKLLEFTLKNLLVNAGKFSFKGGVVLIELNQNTKSAYISIKDNGVGISKSRLEQLFSPEIKSTLGTQKEKGTGLGLYQCKDFVSRMNGEIRVLSKENEGAEFIIRLNLA